MSSLRRINLRLEGITKRFDSFTANDRIDLSVEAGSIHAVLGENGAGKTTLMNVLSGVIQPSAGEIYLNEQPVKISSSSRAIALGIGMIHQHFMLIPTLTVTENILLGTVSHGRLHQAKKSAEILSLGQQYGLTVPPNALVADLSVGVQQRVEILKVLYRQAKVLILDEPTAVLAPKEIESLLKLLQRLAVVGHTIIFISHKLEEVMSISDRITVLRRGKVVASVATQNTSRQTLARWMVGRDIVPDAIERSYNINNKVRLSVQNLWVSNSPIQNLSFEIKSGEIFGVAGIEGHGQRALADAVAGIAPIEAGSVTLYADELNDDLNRQPDSTRQKTNRIGYIPEDRQKMGLVLPFSIAQNLILKAFRFLPFAKWGIFQKPAIQRRADEAVATFNIHAGQPSLAVEHLSGGNQQKVILARELSSNPALIVAMQPTRGLDIGAAQFVQAQLRQQQARGAAILYLSSELEEVIAMSDRIAVMQSGKFVEILNAKTTTIEKIGLLMAGESSSQNRLSAQSLSRL